MRTTTVGKAVAISSVVTVLGAVVCHGFSMSTTRSSSNRPTFVSSSPKRSSTELAMGLFDGVKDAFSAPALERSALDAERETPIDRWMGWSVARDASGEQQKKDIGMCLLKDGCGPVVLMRLTTFLLVLAEFRYRSFT